MTIKIESAKPENARDILELSKVFGSETDNLSFGSAGIPISTEKEQDYLSSVAESDKDIFLIACKDGEIIGTANYASFPKKRMSHRGEIGISIRKSAWGMGIGNMLMKELLDFAKNTAKSDIVSLEVRSDNGKAISLYKKFGFEKIGCFKGYFKIDGVLVDFDLMEKML